MQRQSRVVLRIVYGAGARVAAEFDHYEPMRDPQQQEGRGRPGSRPPERSLRSSPRYARSGSIAAIFRFLHSFQRFCRR